MMTSSNGNIFHVTGPLCGEFTGPGEFPTQRPVTRSFDVFFDLRLNKRMSKQSWCWWFETPSWSLWRHCNGFTFTGPLRGECIIRLWIPPIKGQWCGTTFIISLLLNWKSWWTNSLIILLHENSCILIPMSLNFLCLMVQLTITHH